MTSTAPFHPMVEYLSSLRTQDTDANPSYIEENRGVFLRQLRQRAPWFPADEQLQVTTMLDQLLCGLTSADPPADLVILTGDAGDGKTAVCVKLARRLGFHGELDVFTDVGGWTIVKDASEVDEGRLRTLLCAQLEGKREGLRLIVAANEGRLRRLARVGQPALNTFWNEVVEPSLESSTDEQQADNLGKRMQSSRAVVINFRHRMHIFSVVPRLLTTWTAAEMWERGPACGQCPARATCPILANAVELRQEPTQRQLAAVAASAHYGGQRLPFRRLQAVLALCCTGGLRCRDVQPGGKLAQTTRHLDRLSYRYYQVLFEDRVRQPVDVRGEPIGRSFAPSDGAEHSDLRLDREISRLVTDPEAPPLLAGKSLPSPEAEAVSQVRQAILQGEPRGSTGDDLAKLTRSLRRWVSLSAENEGDGWRRALGLLDAYAERGDGEELRREVVKALNRLHRLDTPKTDALTRRQLDPAAFRAPGRLAIELDLGVELKTALRRGPILPPSMRQWLEARASDIELVAWPSGSTEEKVASLRLDARLVEALLSVSEGYTFLPALGPYRRDLSRFHAQLVALVREAGHEPKVLLRVGERIYGLRSERGGEGRAAKLCLDGQE